MAEKLTLLQKAVKAYNVLTTPIGTNGPKGDVKTNLNRSIAPAQLTRLRHDIGMWRIAIAEAEQAYYPHRVKMQTMFIDTVLNGHVAACIERRKDLTMLRDYELIDSSGNEIEGLEELFDSDWFNRFLSYALDGMFYGYSLIALNDIIDSAFPELTIVKRQNVSPDRNEVTRYIYAQNGDKFLEEPFNSWHVWVKTPSDNGQTSCGYGLLYKVALYEIYLRNTIGYNADFVELYSQPYRVGKTTKTDETERALMEQALQQMGSSGYALIDPNDEIMFLETALGGTGWKGYENLEMRCEQKISKLILGHADALDSVQGKLGIGNGEESPAYLALIDKQTKDGKFIENIVNGQLIPKMRALGFNLPEGIVFRFSNNAETEEVKRNQMEYAGKLVDIAVKLKQAGMGMDEQHFTEETGIPVFLNMDQVKGIEVDEKKLKLSAKAKNKLVNLYS